MTLVGDFGQASRPGAPRAGTRCSANLPVRVPPRRVTLTVNYRTPAEIMDVANRLLPGRRAGRRAGPVRAQHRRVPRGRRRVGARRARCASAADAAARGRDPGRHAWRSSRRPTLHAAIIDALADLGAVADDVEAHRRADRGAVTGSTRRASSSTT